MFKLGIICTNKKTAVEGKKHDPCVSLCNAWNIDDGLQALIEDPYFDGKEITDKPNAHKIFSSIIFDSTGRIWQAESKTKPWPTQTCGVSAASQ